MSIQEMVLKMNRVLEGLIDCQLEFISVSDLSPEQWDPEDLSLMSNLASGSSSASGLIEEQPLLIENQNDLSLGFPVNVRGAFAGLAVVKGWKRKERRPLIQLAELLTTLLENTLIKEERVERRSRLEEKFLVMKSVEEESNVIPLRPTKQSRILELKAQIEQMEVQAAEAPMVSPLTTLPLLIEVREGFPLQRVALEIHEQAGRWAFLSLKDIPADTLNSRESLKELGGITLFIADASELTITQQVKLAEYLQTKPSGDMPHIIAGLILRDDKEVRLIPNLRELFCVTRLEFSNKSAAEITRELVHASLEQLLERARESALALVSDTKARYVPFNISVLDTDNSPRLH